MFRLFVGIVLLLAPSLAVRSTYIRRSTDGLTPSTEDVVYDCTFDGLWTAERHPKEYPASAHWSPPVIASHSTGWSMWETGKKASAGVEVVAETGSTGLLQKEMDAATGVKEYKIGRSQFHQREQTLGKVSMSPTYDRLSSITMIAPSPDWFSGFHNVRPINDETGNWFQRFVVVTAPYDAGTEQGDSYSLSNPDQNPKKRIRKIKKSNAPNGIFLSKLKSGHVKAVAKWICVQEGGLEDCDQYEPSSKQARKCLRRNSQRN